MPTTFKLGIRQTSNSKESLAIPEASLILPRKMYPFCWQGIPLETKARISSSKTWSGLWAEVVETLHKALPVMTLGLDWTSWLWCFLGVSMFFILSKPRSMLPRTFLFQNSTIILANSDIKILVSKLPVIFLVAADGFLRSSEDPFLFVQPTIDRSGRR